MTPALLAFDTATEHMSIALCARGHVSVHEGPGGKHASSILIPSILGLLTTAGIGLRDLDAIAFGRGPGAFTGLRTACSVAQGLAFGAGKPVLPIDTLMAVAEDARLGNAPQRVWVAMDARMNEIYAARCLFDGRRWHMELAPFLTNADELNARWRADPPESVAGNALSVFADRLEPRAARLNPQALPRGHAMLALARSAWEQGGAVDPALALPLYVRDKVAQTTTEREAQRRAKDAAAKETAQ